MRLLPWRRKRTPTSPGALIDLDGSSTMLIAGRKRVLGLPYPNPADMAETNRLDFQHFMLRYAFQGLYAAPISQPTSILDVGTATGRWAIEMAQLFPQARVVGLDVKLPAVDERAGSSIALDARPRNYTF